MTNCTVLDVSAAQGDVDHSSLAASKRCDGEIVKATEGNVSVDTHFTRNWQGALAAGLLLGTYHFAHPDFILARDPEAEAEHYVGTVAPLWRAAGRPPLIWALDIEEARKLHAGPEFVSWCRRFIERVEALTGFACWVYTGGPFWSEHGGSMSADDAAFFAARRLWIAAYVNEPSPYVRMTPWRDSGWTLHQKYGDVGPGGQAGIHYPGVTANVVDTSFFRGTINELRALVAAGAIEPRDTIPAPAPIPVCAPPVTKPETPRSLRPVEPGLVLGVDGPASPLGWQDRAERDAVNDSDDGGPTAA